MPASLDTRRAIARAFEFEDIDVFSKPFSIPSDELHQLFDVHLQRWRATWQVAFDAFNARFEIALAPARRHEPPGTLCCHIC